MIKLIIAVTTVVLLSSSFASACTITRGIPGCPQCTVSEGPRNPRHRVRPDDAQYERRYRGEKNRGYHNGKPYEWHRNHNRNRRSHQR